jgi:nucleotide-binding universal stress UspA family protein
VNGATGRIVLAASPDTPAEAVDAAFDRAAERGLPLLAVRLWHDPRLPLGGWLRPERIARWDAADREARRELDIALAQARAAHPEVEVTTVVADDDPVPFLAALSTRAELLVLGRPTRLGQTSPVDALIHQAACPVLVVPRTPRPSSALVASLASTLSG